MTREGFKVDRKKRMSKKAVCAYFGNRGMALSECEIVAHWIGTYTCRKFDYDAGRSTDEIERTQALAVVIKSHPRGCWEYADTNAGTAEVYGLRDPYAEPIDDVPRPRKRKAVKR